METKMEAFPEEIYVRDAEFAPGGLEVMAVNHESGIKYIRATSLTFDITKYKEAYLRGYSDGVDGAASLTYDTTKYILVEAKYREEELIRAAFNYASYLFNGGQNIANQHTVERVYKLTGLEEPK